MLFVGRQYGVAHIEIRITLLQLGAFLFMDIQLLHCAVCRGLFDLRHEVLIVHRSEVHHHALVGERNRYKPQLTPEFVVVAMPAVHQPAAERADIVGVVHHISE